jgi:uncharacterized membrane protein YobD (UPF0266 family)
MLIDSSCEFIAESKILFEDATFFFWQCFLPFLRLDSAWH